MLVRTQTQPQRVARSKTSPAKVLQDAALDAQEELKPPRTANVQRQLQEGGPTTTMLDLALGIVQRLAKVEENNLKELQFLETCLKAGHSKTTLPCALLDKVEYGGQVQDLLLNMYGDTPSHQFMSCHTSERRKTRESVGRLMIHSEGDEEAEDEDGSPPVCRMPSEINSAATAEIACLMEQTFDAWSFDTFKLAKLTDGNPLGLVGQEVFRRNNLFYLFAIEPDKAKLFFKRAESKYFRQQQVPYHNNWHAADVTQGIHALLGDIGFHVYFDNLSILSIVFSAIVHDIGHDGRNNAFHVNNQDEMALTYNDKSVLENFHVSQTFRMLAAEPDTNFLSGLHVEQFISVRKMVIEVVLGTDMAFHFGHLGNFKALVQKLEEDDYDAWLDDNEAASALRVLVLHAVDISNPAKDIRLSDQWASLLRDEFFQQGDAEKSLGLPVSPLCDREVVKFASSQVGFMQFIVQPTFEVLSPLLSRVKDVILREVQTNMEVWQERKEVESQSAVIMTRSATTGTAPGLGSGGSV